MPHGCEYAADMSVSMGTGMGVGTGVRMGMGITLPRSDGILDGEGEDFSTTKGAGTLCRPVEGPLMGDSRGSSSSSSSSSSRVPTRRSRRSLWASFADGSSKLIWVLSARPPSPCTPSAPSSRPTGSPSASPSPPLPRLSFPAFSAAIERRRSLALSRWASSLRCASSSAMYWVASAWA